MLTTLPSNIMANIAKETRYIDTTGHKTRSIKLNKGDSWLIRFIPKLMGKAPDQMFYARVAKHWMNKKPVTCPRHTDVAFGGDPHAYCPVCEVAEKLMDSSNKAEADYAYSCRASSQWLLWCIVLEKGKGEAEPLSEVLAPYEFWMYKPIYEEFIGYFKNNLRRTPMSIFDYKLGNDFAVTKTAKGTRLDKQDSGPIFDLDDKKFEANIDKIEAACKEPKPPKATEKALEEFADKLEENANKARNGRSTDEGDERGSRRGGGGESRRNADVEEQDEQPVARGRRAAPADEPDEPETETEVEAEAEPEEQAPPRRQARAAAPAEQEDTAPPQPRRARPAATEEPAEQPVSRRRAAPVEAEPEHEQDADAESDADAEADAGVAPARAAAPTKTPPPVSRRTPPPAASRAPVEASDDDANQQADETPAAPRRTAAAAPPQRRAAPAAAADEAEAEQPVARRPMARTSAAEPVDEDENVPEEATDAAPPTKEDADVDETPVPRRTAAAPARPAVAGARSAAPTGAASSRLMSRITSAAK